MNYTLATLARQTRRVGPERAGRLEARSPGGGPGGWTFRFWLPERRHSEPGSGRPDPKATRSHANRNPPGGSLRLREPTDRISKSVLDAVIYCHLQRPTGGEVAIGVPMLPCVYLVRHGETEW